MFVSYVPLIITIIPIIISIINVAFNTQRKANSSKSYSAKLFNLVIFFIIFLAVIAHTIINGLNIIFAIYGISIMIVVTLQLIKKKNKSTNLNISFIGVRKIMAIIKEVLIENNLNFQVYNNAIVVPQLKAQIITKGRFKNVTVKYSIHVKNQEFSRIWDLIQDKIRENSERSRKKRQNLFNVFMLILSITAFLYFIFLIIF